MPALEGLRRHLLAGGGGGGEAAAAVIMPGVGMCARAAAACSVDLGYGAHALVASHKEYEDRAVELARWRMQPPPPPPLSTAAAKHPRAIYRRGGAVAAPLLRPHALPLAAAEAHAVTRWAAEAERVYTSLAKPLATATAAAAA
jgi:hypothetical protein